MVCVVWLVACTVLDVRPRVVSAVRSDHVVPAQHAGRGEDEELNEELLTPAEKPALKPKNFSPENATAKQAAGKRVLFEKGN